MLAKFHPNSECSNYIAPVIFIGLLSQPSIQDKLIILTTLQAHSTWAQHCRLAWRPLVWNVPPHFTLLQTVSLLTKLYLPLDQGPQVSSFTNLLIGPTRIISFMSKLLLHRRLQSAFCSRLFISYSSS